MNQIHAAAIALTFLLSAAAPPDKDATAALRQLVGAWRVVSTGDEKATDVGSADLKMVIRANGRVLFKVGDLTTNDGQLTRGRCGKATVLDLKLAGGQTLRGVYELRGDDLVICFDEAGKPRPAGTVPSGSQWIEKWRRTQGGAGPAAGVPRPHPAAAPAGRPLWERP